MSTSQIRYTDTVEMVYALVAAQPGDRLMAAEQAEAEQAKRQQARRQAADEGP